MTSAAGHLQISNVGVTYSANEKVLDDVTLTPTPGTVTLLCGASGSGKSTVLRLINGLVPHLHEADITGTVNLDGVDVPSAPVHTSGQRCATVFQNPTTQFFTSEVTSELAFANENYGVTPAEIHRRSSTALEAVGITDLADRTLGELSGGQRQKVACAQALAQHTPVLLFDEPTSNLDPSAIDDFAALLAQLKSEGKTIVIAEHRLHFLRNILDDNDRVLVLDGGRVKHRFTGTEFFTLPDATRRTLGLRCLDRPVLRVASTSGDGDGTSDGIDGSDGGIHIDRLVTGYRRRPVLDLRDLAFPAGQVTGLIGPNGAGKSTLMRTMCGLHAPWAGSRIVVDGTELGVRRRSRGRPVRWWRRRSFLVMQDVHRQLFRETARDEVNDDSLLDAMDLTTVADRHPQSLSGGQKQRLVIATALAQGTDAYFFDEPTSGVDYRHLVSVSDHLRSLASDGSVVVVASHDAEFLNHCCDRTVTLFPLPT